MITKKRSGDGKERGIPFAHKLALVHEYRKMMERGEQVDIYDNCLRDRLLKKIGMKGKKLTYPERVKRYQVERERGRSLQQVMRGVGLEPARKRKRPV